MLKAESSMDLGGTFPIALAHQINNIKTEDMMGFLYQCELLNDQKCYLSCLFRNAIWQKNTCSTCQISLHLKQIMHYF